MSTAKSTVTASTELSSAGVYGGLRPTSVPPPSAPTDRDFVRHVGRLYRAVCGESAPAVIRERFEVPWRDLLSRATPDEVARYHWAIDHVADLEALEVACRYRRTLPLLSLQFRLVVHLAETLPQNQRVLWNDRARRGRALVAIAGGAVRTAYKLAKGLWLLRRIPAWTT